MKREIKIRCLICGREFIRKSNGAKLIHEERYNRIKFSSTGKVIACRCGSEKTEFVYEFDTEDMIANMSYSGYLKNPSTKKFQIIKEVVLEHKRNGEINLQKIADEVSSSQDFKVSKSGVSTLVKYMLENRLFTK